MLFFTSNVVQPPALIFMGNDKHENEDLIRWGWPEDVWFHVDKVCDCHLAGRRNIHGLLDLGIFRSRVPPTESRSDTR